MGSPVSAPADPGQSPGGGPGGEAPGSSEDRTVFSTQKEAKNSLMVHFSVIPKLYN